MTGGNRPDNTEAIDEAIADRLVSRSRLAAEAHRLVASTRNTYGEVDPHAGHTGTLVAAQVYALLAVADAVHQVGYHTDQAGGGER